MLVLEVRMIFVDLTVWLEMLLVQEFCFFVGLANRRHRLRKQHLLCRREVKGRFHGFVYILESCRELGEVEKELNLVVFGYDFEIDKRNVLVCRQVGDEGMFPFLEAK